LVKKALHGAGVLAGLSALVACGLLLAGTGRPDTAVRSDSQTRERIAHFFRERFGMTDETKLAVEPLQPYTNPDLYQTTITLGDGTQKRTQDVFITKDYHYLVLGNLYTLGADPKNEIAQHVRERFKLPATMTLTVGPYRDSPFPDFFATKITASTGNQTQAQDFYVTKDKRCFVLGSIFNLTTNLRQEALQTIVTDGQSSQGPAHAPVTIVEFSDLECPSCARFHQFLEKEVIPKYGNQVRIVFKELPLVSIHPWALTGAIACQCAYQLDPATYVPYRSLIFQNQNTIDPTNARQRLLSLGEQIGLNRLQLATCIDAKVSLQRVEENFREATAIGVQSTPTTFINGRRIVGLPSPQEYFKAVDKALRAAR
jgi:protein-disulfide isomerase